MRIGCHDRLIDQQPATMHLCMGLSQFPGMPLGDAFLLCCVLLLGATDISLFTLESRG
jgi:hypothetical protein